MTISSHSDVVDRSSCSATKVIETRNILEDINKGCLSEDNQMLGIRND
jgi:hypothetical protein